MNKTARFNRSEAEIDIIVQLAKKKGEIIDSIDKLVCQHHSKTTFSANQIPGSWSALFKYNCLHGKEIPDNSHLNQYSCDSCREENLPGDQRTVAYDCPRCEIVLGHYSSRGYSYGNNAPLSSGSGINCLCRICETKIGELVFIRR
ncbi:hypothetical protein J4417_04670 [Candidatus Woesearchaeota archaeon]|nr:hypothetical protein [Candidatus Woesearchaeota archaeon]